MQKAYILIRAVATVKSLLMRKLLNLKLSLQSAFPSLCRQICMRFWNLQIHSTTLASTTKQKRLTSCLFVGFL